MGILQAIRHIVIGVVALKVELFGFLMSNPDYLRCEIVSLQLDYRCVNSSSNISLVRGFSYEKGHTLSSSSSSNPLLGEDSVNRLNEELEEVESPNVVSGRTGMTPVVVKF